MNPSYFVTLLDASGVTGITVTQNGVERELRKVK